MPRLRGHHFICLHFFHGAGYDDAFVANLSSLTSLLDQETVEFCEDPDDVCLHCPHLEGRACRYSENADREIREMDRRAAELLGLETGMALSWQSIRERIPEIFPAWHRAYCVRCSWRPACEEEPGYRALKASL